MSAERVTYVDSSALVKLVVHEPESHRLNQYLRGRSLVSSALARAEVARAVAGFGEMGTMRIRDVFARVEFVRINDRVLSVAGALVPVELRTLDAIHLATAGLFGDTLAVVVTYDLRMAEAALSSGLRAISPGL